MHAGVAVMELHIQGCSCSHQVWSGQVGSAYLRKYATARGIWGHTTPISPPYVWQLLLQPGCVHEQYIEVDQQEAASNCQYMYTTQQTC